MSQDNSSNQVNFDFSQIDLTNFLPGILAGNDFYYQYFKAITSVWQSGVLPYFKMLSEIRQTVNYDTLQPQELYILIENANMLGYKFISNFMTQANYLKIVDFISSYFELEGTQQFGNFLGFVKAAKIQIVQLWSQIGINDFSKFYEHYQIDPTNTVMTHPGIDAIGTWYPTSDWAVKYDLTLLGTVTGTQLADFNTTLSSLFYSLAPIHWVLERIVSVIEFTDNYMIDTQGVEEGTFIGFIDLSLDNLTFSGDPLTYNNGINLQNLITIT